MDLRKYKKNPKYRILLRYWRGSGGFLEWIVGLGPLLAPLRIEEEVVLSLSARNRLSATGGKLFLFHLQIRNAPILSILSILTILNILSIPGVPDTPAVGTTQVGFAPGVYLVLLELYFLFNDL